MARGIDPTTCAVRHCDECPPSEFEWEQHNPIDPRGPVLMCRVHYLAAPGHVYDDRFDAEVSR